MRRSSFFRLGASGRRALAAGVLAVGVTAGQAQTPPTSLPPPPAVPSATASAAGPAPSSVLRTQPGPARRLSPAETSAAARSPDDQNPARAIVPQIAIPIGRHAPTVDLPPPGRRPARAGVRPATGGIDDTAARCESREDDVGRAACLRDAERKRTLP